MYILLYLHVRFAPGSGHNSHIVRFTPGKIKNNYYFCFKFQVAY